MTLYARSDVMSVSIPVSSGGCGHTHTRPVHRGAPDRDFRLDCPGCETFLKGGGRTVLHTTPGDKEHGIPSRQARVADVDPCWGATPESVPDTPDELTHVSKREKLGAEQLEMITALAAAKAAGISIPENAMELLAKRLPGALVNVAQTGGPGRTGYEQGLPAAREYGLEDLSTDKLKSMCKQQGLPSAGTRAQLIERLS